MEGAGEPSCLVLAGPSGVGKSTLINHLLKAYPDKFGLSVSHTTRTIRPGETDGVNYHYVTREVFNEDIAKGMFIEHATYAHNLYGTSFSAVDAVRKQGKICILDIEMNGVRSVKKSYLNEHTVYIMVVPPSFEELERRLRGRGDTPEDAMAARLATAKIELEMQNEKDFWSHILVNDNVNESKIRLEKFLFSVFQKYFQGQGSSL